MQTENHDRNSWIVFLLDKQPYAIPSRLVREMTLIDPPARVPNTPKYVQGLINLRGGLLPVFDLRLWLGLPSARDAVEHLIQEMCRREQDHRDWLHELEAAVREKRAFTKATDPHKCAFGKWYDSYQTDNIFIRSLLREFDQPHQAIHGVAARVVAAAEQGDHAAAQQLIDRTRETNLEKMIGLFGRFRENLQESLRQIVVVVEGEQHACALVVDSIESVETLGSTFDSMDLLQAGSGRNLISRIGRRVRDDSPVLIPEVELLLSESTHVTPEPSLSRS